MTAREMIAALIQAGDIDCDLRFKKTIEVTDPEGNSFDFEVEVDIESVSVPQSRYRGPAEIS